MKKPLVAKVMRSRILGYRDEGKETVFQEVCLMTDNSTQIRYIGKREGKNGPHTHYYGSNCPPVETTK